MTAAPIYYRGVVHSAAGWLFQARMWREYARAWDGYRTRTGIGRDWMESVSNPSRQECMDRARFAVKQAAFYNSMGVSA